jgi:hypothetical protein
MTSDTNRLMHADLDDAARGRVDRDRLGPMNPADEKTRPLVVEQDATATRVEAERHQPSSRRHAGD